MCTCARNVTIQSPPHPTMISVARHRHRRSIKDVYMSKERYHSIPTPPQPTPLWSPANDNDHGYILYVYIWIYVFMYICDSAYLYRRVSCKDYRRIYMHKHMYIISCIYINSCICVCVYQYAYIYIHTDTFIYMSCIKWNIESCHLMACSMPFRNPLLKLQQVRSHSNCLIGRVAWPFICYILFHPKLFSSRRWSSWSKWILIVTDQSSISLATTPVLWWFLLIRGCRWCYC